MAVATEFREPPPFVKYAPDEAIYHELRQRKDSQYNTEALDGYAIPISGLVDLLRHRATMPTFAETTASQPNSEAELFARSLQQYSDADEIDEAVTAVYNRLADLLSRGRSPECDEVIAALTVRRLHLRIPLAVLMGTSQAPKDKLPNRDKLLRITRRRYERERSPADAAAIFRHVK